jgi:hypothetical protein
MCARRGSIEPIQKIIVGHIDEKLRPTRFWLTRVGHAQGSRFIGQLAGQLIWNATLLIASVHAAVAAREFGLGSRTSSTGPVGVGVLGVRATKLIHKIWNDSVKVDSIVEPRVGEVNEVSAVAGGERNNLVSL